MKAEQLSLFSSSDVISPTVANYHPNFLTTNEADLLFSHCKQLNWQHNKIRMLGKWIDLPRLEVMHGDSDYRYVYSGSVELKAEPWTPLLHYLRDRVERVTGYRYQLVIGNWYRSGSDHIGWHSDNEKSMGGSPAIASISLGAVRRFQLRRKHGEEKTPTSYELAHGSLILMLPGCQKSHVHRLCKTARPVGERINLTFRPYVELQQ